MKQRLLVTTILALGLAGVMAARAEVIYRWVDADGVVHFGGQPPQGVQATVVSTASHSGGLGVTAAPEADSAPAAGAPEGEAELSYAEQQRRARTERREAAMQENAERQRKCAAMSRQRDSLEPSPRVIIEDENGNPVRMADEDRLARLEEAKSYLAENCK